MGYPDLKIVAAYRGARLGKLLEKPLTPERLRSAVGQALSEPPQWPEAETPAAMASSSTSERP
jgi:hypothetical protein